MYTSPARSSTGWSGSDESESARMNLHPAGHQVHPIGQAVAVAPNPDQIAALDERGDPAAQRRALLVRPAEPLQQLPHGRGMIPPFFESGRAARPG